MGIMEKVPVKFFTRNFFLSSSGYSQPPQGTYLIRLNLMENREGQPKMSNAFYEILERIGLKGKESGLEEEKKPNPIKQCHHGFGSSAGTNCPTVKPPFI